MAPQVSELRAEQLRQAVDPAHLSFQSTAELQPLEEIIGQERALRAISFGIDISTYGYHMFALGPAGTGKTTTIHKFLQREAAKRPVPDDWLYVNNFADPDRPCALRLPAGVGCKLQTDMNKLVEELQNQVPRAFETAEYSRAEEQLQKEYQGRNEQLIQQANEFAQSHGFAIMQTPQGLMLAPVRHGSVLTPEQVGRLDEESQRKLAETQNQVESQLRETMRQIQQLQRESRERVSELDRNTVAYAVDHLIDEIKEQYAQYPMVAKLLDDIRKDIVEKAEAFKQIRQVQQMQQAEVPFAAMLGRQLPSFDEYKVNLIVNNCETTGAPLILARNPNYQNLIGRIEHQGQFGMLVTSFNMIKAGLLHKANGGYLMLDVRDVLMKPMAYEGLMRALKNGVVEIESAAEMYGMLPTRSLDPEPIPLSIKVVLIGDPMLYYLLYAYDPDFRDLFKVKVDFSLRMDRTPETTEQYARFIGTVCREEQLKHFDATGVARVVEHASRLADYQRKLVAKFGDIVDLIRQSSYWAQKNGHELVTSADVKQAVDEKVFRSNQIEQILQEMIEDGSIMIDTQGTCPGQCNGLAVLSLGDYLFGKPSRITARVQMGDKGVVSIDREVKMGGPIHNKGALILAGFLGGRYAADVPLALSATITFEQVYEEIEGDSASSTELYTLLSALSGFPMRQDLAVTGSVNQHGQVQAIGGVNEKIEGYFDVCRAQGFTGTQGVMIPRSNAQNLMLREDVVDAVRQGQFHVYPIATIDEGISLLTGRDAGERQPDGKYPEGSVNRAVEGKLRELANTAKEFMKSEGPGKAGEA